MFSGTTLKDTWTKPRGGGIRGGRWGKEGEGSSGICINDPWTKPQGGRFEGE